ncbi:hypothetical protein F4777DRAFT_577023 [Nemania sp. FL0916]|nr:hypothetical protein F4777DRAFT_577023 [Nemania sp. FL0916]
MADAAGAVAASASAARYRRIRATSRMPGSDSSAFDAASYMNHLRAPGPMSRGAPNRGVGIHFHYGALDNRFVSPGNKRDGYWNSQYHRTSPNPYYVGSPASSCGCSQCYWRDFLTNDIAKYKAEREQLRETYVWNLEELVRRHRTSPTKSRAVKDGELEKLYSYYVGRVREIYDNHSQHHRLLFHDVCMLWEMPERVTLSEEGAPPLSRARTPLSRHSSGGMKTPVPSSSTALPPVSPLSPLPAMENEEVWGRSTTRSRKGKEREVIPGVDGEFGTPTGSIDDRNKGKERSPEETISSPVTTPRETITQFPPLTPSRSNKVSMHQRIRQFWPPKIRGRSSDKSEPTQETRKGDETHERDEQGSAA